MDKLWVGKGGMAGDRSYALYSAAQGTWLTARQFPSLLTYVPRLAPNGADEREPGPLAVMTPDGICYPASDPRLLQEIGRRIGEEPVLLKKEEGQFDQAPLLLISTASLQALHRLTGKAIDHRRFRCNLLLELAEERPFAEEEWIGEELSIGRHLRIEIVKPCRRCVVINRNPQSANADIDLLRALHDHDRGVFGVYARVVQEGSVECGDPVCLEV